MAGISLRLPDKIKMNPDEQRALEKFLQQFVNRRVVGGIRYGRIRAGQQYMSRLLAEAKAYKTNGNMEQLLNIAVYSFLESYAPENPKFHHDAAVDSVTRKKFGGAIA